MLNNCCMTVLIRWCSLSESIQEVMSNLVGPFAALEARGKIVTKQRQGHRLCSLTYNIATLSVASACCSAMIIPC